MIPFAPSSIRRSAAGALLCLAAMAGAAQQPANAANDTATGGVLLDRVDAIVNGDLILESEVDEERRLQAFQPLGQGEEPFSRADAIRRLIDRTLILQQARLQPGETVTDAQVEEEFAVLRRDIPACKAFHCETDAGWNRFIAAQGLTPQELHVRWKERMQLLRFIELRFRMGIRISPQQIQDYYTRTLLPRYAKEKAAPPNVDAVSARIQEILLQQQVGSLLDEWLKTLRAQGTVRVISAAEATP